ncbi:hypothetical protein ABNX05_18010 [Lysinibacillus sp. M3]|uniref:Uncharacterized protein n=1 Tax=Lysinibacillus zambalensis TaxID=3160866 RepID=A0ABV1MVI5_9BACI
MGCQAGGLKGLNVCKDPIVVINGKNLNLDFVKNRITTGFTIKDVEIEHQDKKLFVIEKFIGCKINHIDK